MRPAYQGSNPISDVWSLEALRMVRRYLSRAVDDPGDQEARGWMLLAASFAGMGFGNAGVHLPHGMSYPVSSTVKQYRPPGYAVDHPLVPHGMSVILHTAAVARFTAPADPKRHLRAAQALGADVAGATLDEAGEVLRVDVARRGLGERRFEQGLPELRVLHFRVVVADRNGRETGEEIEDRPLAAGVVKV